MINYDFGYDIFPRYNESMYIPHICEKVIDKFLALAKKGLNIRDGKVQNYVFNKLYNDVDFSERQLDIIEKMIRECYSRSFHYDSTFHYKDIY